MRQLWASSWIILGLLGLWMQATAPLVTSTSPPYATHDTWPARRLPLTATTVTDVVTSTADSGSGSLRAALAAVGPGETISFAAGLGRITLTSGELEISTSLTIAGPAGTTQTISGGHAGRIIQIDAGAQVTLTNLTLTNGQTPVGGYGDVTAANGGAIYNAGTLTISNSTLTENATGAGLANMNGSNGPGGTGGAGGALYNAGTATLMASNVTANTTGNGGGGSSNNSNCTTCVADGGNGGDGGAGAGVDNAGVMTISGSTLSANTTGSAAAGGSGGDCLFCASANGGNGGAGGSGAGVYNSGALTLTTDTVVGNMTGQGANGGVSGFGASESGGNGGAGGSGSGLASTGELTVTSSTLAGNTAGGGGSGAFGYSGVGVNGAGGSGGGLNSTTGTTVLAATIIAGDAAATGPDIACIGSLTSHDYNLLQVIGEGCMIDEPSPSHDILGQNPLLGPLQNNGGPAPTQALLAGSLALDAIPPSSADCPTGIDQRGLGRPYPAGGSCDIGAVEMHYPIIAGLVPSSNPLPGGAPVVVSGTALTGVVTITFGSLTAVTTTINANPAGTALTVTSPLTSSPGSVPVQVTTSEGVSSPASVALFTYTVPMATPTNTPTQTSAPTNTATATQTPTATAQAVLVVSPPTNVVFQTETVTGTRFGAQEPVALYWDSTRTTALTTTIAGGRGAFIVRVTIPPATEGEHHVIAVGQHTDRSASAAVSVTPTLVLTPTMGAPGSMVTVSGYGFQHEVVRISWNTPAQVLGSKTANTMGSFAETTALTVTVPLSATVGLHTITGIGQTSHVMGMAVFTVR